MPLTISRHRSLIRVTGAGFFTMDEVHEHFVKLAIALAEEHLRGRVARVIVDLRLAQTQSQDVASYIRFKTNTMYADTDLVGIVVPSPLLRSQLKRIHAERRNFGIFLDQVEASRFVLQCTSRLDTAV